MQGFLPVMENRPGLYDVWLADGTRLERVGPLQALMEPAALEGGLCGGTLDDETLPGIAG
jgi:hypothetical protein